MADHFGGSVSPPVTIVTGAAHGLGEAYARRLAAGGHHVGVLDVDGEAAVAVAESITADGHVAFPAVADVTSDQELSSAVAAIRSELGPVTGLVANAGGALFPPSPVEAVDSAQWDRIVAVNLKGAWLSSRAVVPGFMEHGSGAIVTVASTTVYRGYPDGLAAYTSAKAGVIGLTRAMAHELGPAGIRVNAIAPGYIPVATPKDVHSDQARQRLAEQMIDEQALKRLGTPVELADVVAFLISDAARFVTGQVVNVDGGWAMR